MSTAAEKNKEIKYARFNINYNIADAYQSTITLENNDKILVAYDVDILMTLDRNAGPFVKLRLDPFSYRFGNTPIPENIECLRVKLPSSRQMHEIEITASDGSVVTIADFALEVIDRLLILTIVLPKGTFNLNLIEPTLDEKENNDTSTRDSE